MKNPKKKIYNAILNLLILVSIITILFSTYNIIMWFIENKRNDDLLSDIQSKAIITKEQILVDKENVEKINYDFTELLSINSNTVGWINVPNTNINYPIVKYTDNEYYLTHSFNNSNNSAGWVFADCNNKFDGSDYNTIVYGHNRKDKSMFGSLKNVLTADWTADTNNYYINLSTLSSSKVYKVFSAFICDDKNYGSYLKNIFSSDEEFNSFVEKLKNKSTFDFNTNVDDTEKIVTLCTCHGLNNQRLIVCAKLIE